MLQGRAGSAGCVQGLRSLRKDPISQLLLLQWLFLSTYLLTTWALGQPLITSWYKFYAQKLYIKTWPGMRSSRVARAYHSQWRSRNCHGFDPQHHPTQRYLEGGRFSSKVLKKLKISPWWSSWDLIGMRRKYCTRTMWVLANELVTK